MRFFLFILSLLLISVSLSAVGSPLRTDGDRFLDQEGNHVILRGVNVSGASKVPPFRGTRGPEDFRPLPSWGFNSVRLLFNWEAFQPEKEGYDEDYLQYYVDQIRWAALYDLFVIVDIHQDAFSRFTALGCGEGFPKWAIPQGFPSIQPRNDQRCKFWGITSPLDPFMHQAWHHFYQNTHGVRDQYMIMLQKLSQAVANEPNVIGVNLLNEPWGDEKNELFPLYNDAAQVVRREIPNTILFLSAAAVTSTGVIPSKLPKLPGENIVHETHFYDPAFLFKTWTKLSLNASAKNWKRVAGEWKAPVFLGEFGTPPDINQASGFVDNIYSYLDRELASGAYWVYTPSWNDINKDGWNQEDFSISVDGKLRGQYVPRPWVEKVSGQILAMKWDALRKELSIDYRPSVGKNLVQIVVPESYKWSGLKEIDGETYCNLVDNHRLRCEFPEQTSDETAHLTFKINK